MNKRILLLAMPAALALGGCVTVPTSPTVMVLPGPQKTMDQFQSDNLACQQRAYNLLAPAGEAAVNNAAANAAVGTALGAAAGAIIGSVTGQAGQGAAIGAGTGLLYGSAAGGNAAYMSNFQMQQQYNATYMQCMYALGNQVPGAVVSRRQPVYSYPPPSYPPPNYPPPNYPPPNYPPPNTPPPAGATPQG
ncbi:MAG TPA: glycine zipper family protein [Casimicrobiaceae bacterium]|nr:glycine zipper family protein [Casimicrobiaceae bacterium]